MPRLHSLFWLPHGLRRRARRSRMNLLITLLLLACILVAPFYLIYKPPSVLISFFQRRWPDVLFQVQTAEKLVALTIDDAPSDYTQEIQTVLRENEAKATFFVIGSQVAGRQAILTDLVRDGHELGNHAMRDEASRSIDDEKLAAQIEAVQGTIRAAYSLAGKENEPPKYFRPGSGFFSDHMRMLLAGLDFRLVLGSIYPHDPQISVWQVNARHILSMLRPGGIIICHDRRSWTVPMLKSVLPEIKRRGYRVMTVTELLQAVKS